MINEQIESNLMVDDSDRHIICITEFGANKEVTDGELGLEVNVMFRKDEVVRKTVL